MNFWITDLKVKMPAIGLIARNAHNFQAGREGWMNAEEKLCMAYKKYVSQIPRNQFLQRIEYMKLARDLGRTPMSKLKLAILVVLIAAESAGFCYMLSTWIARDASANLTLYIAIPFVCVVAILLAILTHSAGEQYYRTRLIRSCLARYKERGVTEFHSTRTISLSDDQFADNADPEETRCLNRIIETPHDRGSYGIFIFWLVTVISIAALAWVMRNSHMDSELTRESQATESTVGNPFAKPSLPAELTEPQQYADKKASSEILSNTKIEGNAANLFFVVIFLATQFVGFKTGREHCFAGRETYKEAMGSNRMWFWSEMDGAYANTEGYSTYDAYWEGMQPIKDIVNARLKALQQLLNQNSPRNLSLGKTFDDYLAMQAKISMESKAKHNALATELGVADSSMHATAPLSSAVDSQQSISPLAQAKHDLEAITDKALQQAYFVKLPPDLREDLKPWLKERKERATAAVSQAELDSLF